MAEVSTWLKVGTTALVLEALQKEPLPSNLKLADPLGAHRSISRDEKYAWEISLQSGMQSSAVDLQQNYLEWVERYVDLKHPEKRHVIEEWKATLEMLRKDVFLLRNKLDWVAKRWLLDTFRESEGVKWSDPWLQSLDLEYHLLNREQGLFYALEATGEMERLSTEVEVLGAMQQPPSTTRAYIRGKSIQKFSKNLKSAQWDHLIFHCDGQTYQLDLSQAFPGQTLEELRLGVDQASKIKDLIRILKLKPTQG
jgi:hypothetical protein